jgi:hypothetical protein
MKNKAVLLLIFLSIFTTSSVFADGRGHRNQNHHWDDGRHNSWNNHNRGQRHSSRNRNNSTHISLNFGSYFGSRLYSDLGRNYRSPSLGYRPSRVIHYETPRVNRAYSTRQTSPRRSLLRGVNGYCYERWYNSNGEEVREEVDSSACNF